MGEVRWHRIDVPDGMMVEHLTDESPGRVVVSGLRDEMAYAAWLAGSGELTDISIPPEAAAHGPARVVRTCGQGVMGVCGSVGLWGRETPEFRGVATEMAAYPVPLDERGVEAAWLWVTAGDDQLVATAAYPTADGHELRVLDLFTRLLIPVERRLVTGAPLDQLHVAGFAGRVTVAGLDSDPGPPSVWWSTCALLAPEEYRADPVPWLAEPLEGSPAWITDGIDSGSLSFYAGLTGDGLVALWDGTGELREVTDLRADPEAPVALLAELEPWGEGWAEPDGLAAFVVQAAEGNVLSFRGGTYAAPSGRLRKAVVNRGFDRPRCFVLLDDDPYMGELEY
jgi:hypothetical protein